MCARILYPSKQNARGRDGRLDKQCCAQLKAFENAQYVLRQDIAEIVFAGTHQNRERMRRRFSCWVLEIANAAHHHVHVLLVLLCFCCVLCHKTRSQDKPIVTLRRTRAIKLDSTHC